MTLSFAYKALAAGTTMALLSGCAAIGLGGTADERWAEYKTWETVSDEPSTGASPGLGAVHAGPDGYRIVYVNAVGRDTIKGDGPYVYPEGTVIVKEQYEDEAAYDSGSGAAVTVSLKIAEGEGADTWHWSESYTSTAGESAFCSGCHSIPFAKDFVFSNVEYLAAHAASQ